MAATFIATGLMVRDPNWVDSSHGVEMTALEEVTSNLGIGDMLRYDNGKIVKGLFNGRWVRGMSEGMAAYADGETVNMGRSVEPQATSIMFRIWIEADQWTPDRWDSFGVETDLLMGSTFDQMLQLERRDNKSH